MYFWYIGAFHYGQEVLKDKKKYLGRNNTVGDQIR